MLAGRVSILSIALSGWSVSASGGIEPQALSVGLDADGKAERITWGKFAETENEGDFYQVEASDDDGSLLWEGPKVAAVDNPLVFGDWHFGYSLPELAADLDGDGTVELVTPAPQSDVSPTFFRVLRWRGGRFVLARSGTLLEAPKGTGRFPWSEAEEWQGTWISSFLAANGDGTLRVEWFEYHGGVEALTGEGFVAPVEGGYEVRRWSRPMERPKENGRGVGWLLVAASVGLVAWRWRAEPPRLERAGAVFARELQMVVASLYALPGLLVVLGVFHSKAKANP